MEYHEIKNKSRYIQANTERMLWAASAGICEFRGCRNSLITHPVTKENIPLAEKAHIYAFSEGGKRYSRLLNREKINDIANLILVCDGCHELIDSEDTNYSANELIDMKNEHEERVARLVSLKPDLQSEIIIYNANIADSSIMVSDYVAMSSITPQYYPARSVPYKLSPELHLYDNETEYWKVMARDLGRAFIAIEPVIRDKHISLFAIAPQPLLFKLGTLLNRNYNVDVRQPQGSIGQWQWSETKKTIELEQITLPELIPQSSLVLTLELSARLSEEELRKVFSGHAVYRITCTECNPMVIRCKADLQAVMEQYRVILNRIRAERGSDVQILLVPIAPASVTIEAGRQLMKGDPQVVVYDRNYLTKEWTKALVFNGEENA